MIVYFAPTILTHNGFSTTAALNVSVGLGLSYLVMQIIGMAIVDKVGRRRLTLIMVPGAAISLFVLGTLFITGNTDRHTVAFIIGSIILFMLFNAGGLQLMGWLTGSEIYPLAVRGAGMSAQSATLLGHQPAHHADIAAYPGGYRGWGDDVDVRHLQRHRMGVQ